MSVISFKCTVQAPIENIWKTLMDEVEHPDAYNNGILGVSILERFHDGVLRSVKVPDADVREKVLYDYENKTVESKLVGHPSLVGVIRKVISPNIEDPQSHILESHIEWETIDDRVDGMIRRNMESFITKGLERVKERAEAIQA
ncbi:hypothetical protein [Pseudobacteriovorax antillogorgiicola]|uniref:Polyketide cyclase / dehydrase and lipid transport n=1 Tax=Pseudobacteriovorax antillogorgiicola TaxID=1513793 RepID=A0A1Y6CH06_9BACT|nr:hypothetical protein [Pseudobacteriovorax antillogorgiicola]TCS47258.1 hypothetical protein EDD56_12133 [Pseudobacteriovorax antillogorgiicola]SMF62090.1 hypothetical protein SAMN06296036_12133 [Pseudobacteriovorax antillogorgiicola]